MYITVAELPEYARRAERLLNENERNEIIDYLSTHPETGDLLRGTGGIRKIRWKGKGKGKRGGVRVIYFYYNKDMPLFLLTIFGKSEKVDLRKAERNELAKLTRKLVDLYKEEKK